MNTMDFGSNMEDGLTGLPPVTMEPAVVREPPKAKRNNETGESTFADDRVIITLEDNEQIPPTGQFFGVDGVGYMLKANMKAAVPKGLIDVLDAAIMALPVKDPQTLQVIGFSDRLRFPYRVHGHLPAGTPFKVAA